MTITATIAGAISMLAQLGMFFGGRRNNLGVGGSLLMLVLGPIAAMIVQMASTTLVEISSALGSDETVTRPGHRRQATPRHCRRAQPPRRPDRERMQVLRRSGSRRRHPLQ